MGPRLHSARVSIFVQVPKRERLCDTAFKDKIWWLKTPRVPPPHPPPPPPPSPTHLPAFWGLLQLPESIVFQCVFVLFYTYCGKVLFGVVLFFVFCFFSFTSSVVRYSQKEPLFWDYTRLTNVQTVRKHKKTQDYLDYPLAASLASQVRRFSFSIHTSNQSYTSSRPFVETINISTAQFNGKLRPCTRQIFVHGASQSHLQLKTGVEMTIPVNKLNINCK